MLYSRRSFTLLEIFLVLMIISVVGTLAGVRISSSLKKYRFEHSARRLKTQLDLCRDLAVNIQSDLRCTLKQTAKGIEYTVQSLEGAELFKGQAQLQEFFDHIYFSDLKQKDFSIDFFSSGAISLNQPLYVYSQSHDYALSVFDSYRKI